MKALQFARTENRDWINVSLCLPERLLVNEMRQFQPLLAIGFDDGRPLDVRNPGIQREKCSA